MPEVDLRKQVLASKLRALETCAERVEQHEPEAAWRTSASELNASDTCKRDIVTAAQAELGFAARTASRPTAEALFRLAACLETLPQGDDRLGLFAELLNAMVEVRLLSDALYKQGYDPTQPGEL